MTLFTATLLLAILFLIEGLAWFTMPLSVQKAYNTFMRHPISALVFFGGATAWVLWHITQLGEADFGEHKKLLFILFLAVSIGCFTFVKDFLAVRGWSIIMLLLSNVFLNAAFLQEPQSRLIFVSYVYIIILLALYFAAVPYKLRDFSNWAFSSPTRTKTIASTLTLSGIILTITAFSY